MIRQLCYLSTAASPMEERALERIVAGAERFNRMAGVTGLLAHGEGVIFQILEGPRDNVAAAFARICRDRRHHSIRLLQDECVATRDFAGSPMAVRTLEPGLIAGLDTMVSAQAIPAIIAGIGHGLPVAALHQMVRAA